MWKTFFKGPRVTEDLDAHYPVRTDCGPGISSKFRPRVKKRLTEEAWRAAFDAKGRLVKLDGILKAIKKGGCEPSIRAEVWEFLLGVYSATSTSEERASLRQTRREIYASLKAECHLVDPVVGTGVIVDFPRVKEDGADVPLPRNYDGPPLEQFPPLPSEREGWDEGLSADEKALSEKREEVLQRAGPDKVMQWRMGLHQIGVDVLRADRTLQFYEEEGNSARLMDVLAMYSWFDSAVGYCQGMADLMSPLVVLFPNNADAFWCFERLMRQVRRDFIGSAKSLGVQKELKRVAVLLKLLDPSLYEHLDNIGAGTLYFTVRPLMAMFRRELSFADALYFWEMLWAWEYDQGQVEQMMHEDKLALGMALRNPAKASDRVTYLETAQEYEARCAAAAAVRMARAGAPFLPSSDSMRGPVALVPPDEPSAAAAAAAAAGSEPLPDVPQKLQNKAARLARRQSMMKFISMRSSSTLGSKARKGAAMGGGRGGFRRGDAGGASRNSATGWARSGDEGGPVSGPMRLQQSGSQQSGDMAGERNVGKGFGSDNLRLRVIDEGESEAPIEQGKGNGFRSDSVTSAGGARDGGMALSKSESVDSVWGRGGALPDRVRMNTFCVLALLIGCHDRLAMQCDGMDEVVDVFNEATQVWDVKQLCKAAEELRQRYKILQQTAA